jgi:hypothetical protein
MDARVKPAHDEVSSSAAPQNISTLSAIIVKTVAAIIDTD